MCKFVFNMGQPQPLFCIFGYKAFTDNDSTHKQSNERFRIVV